MERNLTESKLKKENTHNSDSIEIVTSHLITLLNAFQWLVTKYHEYETHFIGSHGMHWWKEKRCRRDGIHTHRAVFSERTTSEEIRSATLCDKSSVTEAYCEVWPNTEEWLTGHNEVVTWQILTALPTWKRNKFFNIHHANPENQA